ncbi:hypothetical protein [Anatilimnocola floriformis]|uniref:hypothetical protein n=1 Tax=Anatilimnocola floriformis TaxID=2948575 RepID=UPI0020C520EC|nr:hypothetical protein [Anatilimnocola floriformis]
MLRYQWLKFSTLIESVEVVGSINKAAIAEIVSVARDFRRNSGLLHNVTQQEA